MDKKVINLEQRKKQMPLGGKTAKDHLESGKSLFITITENGKNPKKYRVKLKDQKKDANL